jgi:DNA-binding protein YbaB
MTSSEKECLLRLEEKLDQVQKSVEKNAKEISDLKATVNMGKGAVKALIWIGSSLTVLAGLFKYGDGI